MRRLLPLAALAVFTAAGQTPPPVLELLTRTASALSEDDASLFMKSFDAGMAGYRQLRTEAESLLDQAYVSSSVEIRGDSGGDATRELEVDWYLEIKSKYKDGPSAQRRQIAHCRVTKRGDAWRITAFDPLSLFAPLIAP